MVFATAARMDFPEMAERADLSVSVLEARRLADRFNDVAYRLLDLREARADDLTQSQGSVLFQCAQSLLMASMRVRTDAVGLAIPQVAHPGRDLLAAFDAALTRLDGAIEIKPVIRIASCFVDISVGLQARDPLQVDRALKALAQDLNG